MTAQPSLGCLENPPHCPECRKPLGLGAGHAVGCSQRAPLERAAAVRAEIEGFLKFADDQIGAILATSEAADEGGSIWVPLRDEEVSAVVEAYARAKG